MDQNIDINSIAAIKVHPAIGVARITRNSDYFEFFDFYSKPISERQYMSKGQPGDPHFGRNSLKRQAVKFQAFAYDSEGNLLGNLCDDPGFEIDWNADLANRKVHFRSIKRNRENPLRPVLKEVKATGSTTGQDSVELEGRDPWGLNKVVPLGTLHNDGLFVPAKVSIVGKLDNEDEWNFDDYTGYEFLELTDTTCDGTISVKVSGPAGELDIPVFPAWLIVAAPRHGVGITPGQMEQTTKVLPAGIIGYNYDWIRETRENVLNFEGDISDPTGLDTPMFNELNGEYRPGIELCLDNDWMEEDIFDVKDLFYLQGQGFVKENEIRMRPKGPGLGGAQPGQLTSGLCSQWQGDMATCLDYWTAENPEEATDFDGETIFVIHAEGNKKERLSGFRNVYEQMDLRPIAEGKYDPLTNTTTFDIIEPKDA